ncbi:MAG: hypothetical protein FJY25_01945 [Betaproteobacteria bacterium]|nr:hypothetical protein [Betaproteobacteria bacterium]
MGKITLWLALAGLVWLGWTLWRLGQRRADSRRAEASSQHKASHESPHHTPSAGADPPAPEPMLRCAHCGLYLPAADTVVDKAGQSYCGTAHRDAAERAAGTTGRRG